VDHIPIRQVVRETGISRKTIRKMLVYRWPADFLEELEKRYGARSESQHFQNPQDNQGIRYVLAGCLMKSGDIEALKKLLKRYDEDSSAPWLYTQVLVAFRENGASEKTEALARKAWIANNHVPAVLAGTKKAKSSTNGYVIMGGENEAAYYVEEWGFDWVTTPGAVDWLTKVAAEMAATRTGRRSVH
jgi:hypothetical protein